nr:retrovirus-related Pol polyprotein from transposon TNT 1-94 [Tanacetum cinerariifolium]
MIKKSLSLENEPCCSKTCKKNTDNLNLKITELSDKLDDKNGESTDSILSKPAVKFVKASERSTSNKVEAVKKPSVRYAKLYRKPSKKPTVKGNQRNWNNLKSQQLESPKAGEGVKSKNSYSQGIKLKDSVRTKRSRGTRNLKIQKLNIKFRGVKTPMVPPNNLGPDLSGKSINETQYRGIIGSLMYLTTSRPDIQFSTCLHARYQANPKETHLIFRKSTSGACQLLGGKLVCWSAKKQQFLAMSLAEAEYVAVTGCCATILWMKSQLTDYDIIYERVPIFCDNTSAIAISNNPVLHSKTKHIDIIYHFIRDHVLKGDIELHFIPTQYQLADIFTKPLEEPTFKRLIVELELTINPAQVFSVHNLTLKPNQPEEPPFTDHMKAIYNLDVPMDFKALKPSSQTEEDKSPSHPSPPTPVVGDMHKETQQAAGGPTSLGVTSEEGAHPQLNSGSNPSVLVDKTKSARDGLKIAHTDSGANEESRVDDISLLSDILKDTGSAFFTPDSPPYEPIIISDESEEEEEVVKDKDTSSKKEEIEQAKAKSKAKVEGVSMKAKPSYPYIHQLIELLVTSLKPELSKLLALHDFASCLPTELKELPSKITRLSKEIKELKKHVRDIEIELPVDLKEIPTKPETFTSTIFSLLSQVAEQKNIQWELPTEFLNFPSQVSSV